MPQARMRISAVPGSSCGSGSSTSSTSRGARRTTPNISVTIVADMPFTVKATGQAVSLDDISPRQDGGCSKQTAKPRLVELSERLHDLQEALYAAHHHSALILLQG